MNPHLIPFRTTARSLLGKIPFFQKALKRKETALCPFGVFGVVPETAPTVSNNHGGLQNPLGKPEPEPKFAGPEVHLISRHMYGKIINHFIFQTNATQV